MSSEIKIYHNIKTSIFQYSINIWQYVALYGWLLHINLTLIVTVNSCGTLFLNQSLQFCQKKNNIKSYLISRKRRVVKDQTRWVTLIWKMSGSYRSDEMSNGKWHRYLFACLKSYSYHWWFIRVGLDVPFFQPRLQVGKCQSHFVDYISRFVGHTLIFVDHILLFVDHMLIFVDHSSVDSILPLKFDIFSTWKW